MRKLVRGVVGLVGVLEAAAFFAGAALHLGIPLPVPFIAVHSLPAAVLETGSGVFLLVAAVAILAHGRRAWQMAVAAHVAGVASITFGIATGGGDPVAQSGHQTMLIVLIVVLIVLSTPLCRHALDTGRRHSRRRRRILQTL